MKSARLSAVNSTLGLGAGAARFGFGGGRSTNFSGNKNRLRRSRFDLTALVPRLVSIKRRKPSLIAGDVSIEADVKNLGLKSALAVFTVFLISFFMTFKASPEIPKESSQEAASLPALVRPLVAATYRA